MVVDLSAAHEFRTVDGNYVKDWESFSHPNMVITILRKIRVLSWVCTVHHHLTMQHIKVKIL